MQMYTNTRTVILLTLCYAQVYVSAPLCTYSWGVYTHTQMVLLLTLIYVQVYVSAPTTVKKTSDEVFYTRHIDGPYYYVPFASCFRMIIGMDAVRLHMYMYMCLYVFIFTYIYDTFPLPRASA
jgi:hypothetical protein